MGNYYLRVGNRTLKNQDARNLSDEDRRRFIEEAKRADQIRLENMRKGLGLEPEQKAVTLDVTPEGVAKRQEAIKAEEAKIAEETEAIEKDLGPAAPGFVEEAEAPPRKKKTTRKKKTA